MAEKQPGSTATFKWIEKISRILDSKYSIPGTKFRFGLDPILGLFPGVGDITTFTISSMLILAMTRHGASGKVVVLMILNILVDTIFGAIPIIGNIFDFFFKANERNIRLLKRHYEDGKYQGSGKGILVITLIVLLVLLILIVFLMWKLLVYIFEFLTAL